MFAHLIAQLLEWKGDNLEIILLGDFNENVYKDRLACPLAEDDLNMKEQCLQVTGEKLPATHVRGSRPIVRVFATAGVIC